MVKTVRVVPALLTDDPSKLELMVRQSETFTGWVQVDIMDGRFVPSRSVTAEHLAALSPRFGWEAHLMVLEPEKYLADFRAAGASRVVFHYEATTEHREVIRRARALGLSVGLALNPETPVAAILPLVDEVETVLFLSVHPGFYGAQFLPEVLDKIAELRCLKPELTIGIDGGIKEGNVTQIARTGANDICVGSAIFHDSSPAESFRKLTELARGAWGAPC